MGKGRLEAFSDGVLAIIITIMVLELRVPADPRLSALQPLIPVLLSYIMSFVFMGIYWSNHHHLIQAAERVTGPILWANLHLLFWLSLTPFTTAWMGENHFAEGPVAAYGVVLLGSAIAYYILELALIAHHGRDSRLAQALGSEVKGRVSIAIYATGIAMAFVDSRYSGLLYATVAIIWLIPDRRIERTLQQQR